MVWKKMSVRVSDPTVSQELDTPGLRHVYTPPKQQERAHTNIFSTILEEQKLSKRARKPLGVASFSFPVSNEAQVLHYWLT